MTNPSKNENTELPDQTEADETEQGNAFEALSGLATEEEEEPPKRDFKGLIGCGG